MKIISPLKLSENTALNQTYYDTYANARKYGEIYYWGTDNLAPDKLIELQNVSPTHNALIDLKKYMLDSYTVIASALELALFDEFSKITLDSLIRNIIRDYVTFNTFSIKLCPTQGRYNLLDYVPINQVRYGSNEDADGKPVMAYVSRDWSNLRLRSNRKYSIPLFTRGMKADSLEANHLYIYRDDDLYTSIYQTPNYFSGINNILYEHEISIFNLAATRNGWAPRMFVTTFGANEEGEAALLADRLDEQYQGSHNAGKVVMMNVANKDFAPEVTSVDYSLNADSYIASVNSAREYIMSAHKCTSPALAGLSINGGFEGQGTALLAAYKIYDQMVVSSMRTIIEREINKVLKLSNFDITVKFYPKELTITEDESFSN